jgi:hypothetical protein
VDGDDDQKSLTFKADCQGHTERPGEISIELREILAMALPSTITDTQKGIQV